MASAHSPRTPKSHILRQKAMNYYNYNGVPQKMEEILNKMFYDDPPDIHGYLANYFNGFSKPAHIGRLQAMQVFDSSGQPTIQTDVFCTVNNIEKKTTTTELSFTNIKAKAEEHEKAEVEIQNSMSAAINIINTDISKKLNGFDPREQAEVDKILMSVIEKLREEEESAKAALIEEDVVTNPSPPAEDKDKKKHHAKKHDLDEPKGKGSAPIVIAADRPLEVFAQGSEAVAAVSQAVCACAAASHNIPVYRHVASLARSKGALNEFRVPLPMVTIIQSGKFVPGKVNCVKEYMIVPGIGMSVEKSIEHIHHIYHHVAKSIAAKSGPAGKYVNECGALCPQLENPTQALDMLQEAVNAQGLTIGEDMYLAINAAAYEFFDYEKGRYEVTTGVLKQPDDMVDFWADIVAKYPALIAIIDPIRGEDTDAWMKLAERVSESVYVVGDRFYQRPGKMVQAPPCQPPQTSGVVLYVEQLNTISDLIEFNNMVQELHNEVIISANHTETTDTFIVDFAVGVNARFLKIGGPCRGDRSCKLNRLMQISLELGPPLPTESQDLASPKESVADPDKDNDNTEAEAEEDLKIDISETQEDSPEQSKAHEAEEVKEEQADAASTKDEEPQETLWGQNEPSRCKPHAPFVFPMIEIPVPPAPETETVAE